MGWRGIKQILRNPETYMLLGEYRHTLDDKNRVSLPAKFRKELGKKVIITRGLDRCLSVYSMAEFKNFSEDLTQQTRFNQSNSRAYDRFIASGAIETDVDSAGRILIPDFLKQYGQQNNRCWSKKPFRTLE